MNRESGIEIEQAKEQRPIVGGILWPQDKAQDQRAPAYHATLTFEREELLYDIKNYAYIEGHIMDADAEHAKHMTKDVGEDGNVDRITRLMDLYHAAAVEMLYAYSRHDLHVSEEGNPWHDRLEEQPQYRIDLLLPKGFSQTTVNLLEKLIHEWIVCRCLADWLAITNPEKAAAWAMRADKAEEDIKSAMAHRQGRVRRPLNPF